MAHLVLGQGLGSRAVLGLTLRDLESPVEIIISAKS